jgi:hypothetical protein
MKNAHILAIKSENKKQYGKPKQKWEDWALQNGHLLTYITIRFSRVQSSGMKTSCNILKMQQEGSSKTLVSTHTIYSVISRTNIIIISITKLKHLHSRSEIIF